MSDNRERPDAVVDSHSGLTVGDLNPADVDSEQAERIKGGEGNLAKKPLETVGTTTTNLK